MGNGGGHVVVPKSQSITRYHAHWQYGVARHCGGDVGGAGSHDSAAAPGTVGHPLPPNGGHCPTTFWKIVSRHSDLIVTKVHRSWSGIGSIERLDVFHGERLPSCSSGTTSTAPSAVGAPVPHPRGPGKARWTTGSLAACTSSISAPTMVGISSANRTGTTIHLLLKEWSPQQLWGLSLSICVYLSIYIDRYTNIFFWILLFLLCLLVEVARLRYVEMLGIMLMINGPIFSSFRDSKYLFWIEAIQCNNLTSTCKQNRIFPRYWHSSKSIFSIKHVTLAQNCQLNPNGNSTKTVKCHGPLKLFK